MYLTPAQYRAGNFGFDVSDMIDAELAPILDRASADVDGYCQQPANHSFLGGTVIGETHTWHIDPYGRNNQRRVFPYHRPVIEIASMRIHATATQYLELSAAELYYEASEGWIEPMSSNLTSYGLFGSSVLPFVGLTEPFAILDYTYGYELPSLERLWYQGNGGATWRGSTGFWSPATIAVYVNGVQRTTDFTIDRDEGTVTFTGTIPSGTDKVTASVVGTLPRDIMLATGIIATSKLSDRKLLADGVPSGLRAFKVAEVSVERDYRRNATADVIHEIPPEAADKLGPYVWYPLAMA